MEDNKLGYYSVIRAVCELLYTEVSHITTMSSLGMGVSTQIKSQLQKNCGKQGRSS